MLLQRQINKIKQKLGRKGTSAASVFNALGDPGRLKIFRLLAEHKGLCVTDIAHILSVSVPAASHQLKILEQADLVVRERMGQMICYRLKSEETTVRSTIKLMEAIA